MKAMQGNYLGELQLINNQNELFETLSQWTEALGFKYFSFLLRSPLPISDPKKSALSNFPESWQHAYVRNS